MDYSLELMKLTLKTVKKEAEHNVSERENERGGEWIITRWVNYDVDKYMSSTSLSTLLAIEMYLTVRE